MIKKAGRFPAFFISINFVLYQKLNSKKQKGEIFLKKYTLSIDPAAAKFYETLARRTGTTPEKLMASTLFKFAGEISVNAILENINGES